MLLDLKTDEGQRVFRSMVAKADGVINNLRSAAAVRLGLRYDQLKDVNPKVVCCSACGWGRAGERAKNAAYDYLLQAYIGHMALTGDPGQPPARSAIPWVDTSTGITAALGLVAGIVSAQRTGRGRDVDVSMVDVGMSQWMYLAAWYLTCGEEPQRQPMSAHPSIVPSQLLRTLDGYVIVMPQTQAFWQHLCVGVGLPGLIEDPRFATMADRRLHKTELLAILEPVFAARSSDHWLDALAGRVPIEKVNTFAEAMEAYRREYPSQVLEWQHETLGTVRAINSPIRAGGSGQVRRAPRLGEHTEEEIEGARQTERPLEASRESRQS